MDQELYNLLSEIDKFKINLVNDDRNIFKSKKNIKKKEKKELKCKSHDFDRDFKKHNISVNSVLDNSFGVSRSRDNTYASVNVTRDNYILNKTPLITNRNYNTFDSSYESQNYDTVIKSNEVKQENKNGHQEYYIKQNEFINKELLLPNVNIQKPLNQYIKEHTLVIDSVDRNPAVYNDLFSFKVSFNGNTKPYFSDVLKRTRYLRLDKLILPNSYKIAKVDTPYQSYTDCSSFNRQYTVGNGNIIDEHEYAIQLNIIPSTVNIKPGDIVKLVLHDNDDGGDFGGGQTFFSFIQSIVGKTLFLPLPLDGINDIALGAMDATSELHFYNLDSLQLSYPNPFLITPIGGANTITNEIIGKYRVTYKYSDTEYSFQSLETGNYYYRNGSEYYYPDPSYEIGADRYIHMSIEEIDENNDYATNSVSMKSFGLLYPASVSRGYAYISTSYSDVSYSMSNLKDLTSLTFKFYDSIGKQITCSDNLQSVSSLNNSGTTKDNYILNSASADIQGGVTPGVTTIGITNSIAGQITLTADAGTALSAAAFPVGSIVTITGSTVSPSYNGTYVVKTAGTNTIVVLHADSNIFDASSKVKAEPAGTNIILTPYTSASLLVKSSDDINTPYHPSHYIRHPLFTPRQLHMVFKAGQVVVEQERSDII